MVVDMSKSFALVIAESEGSYNTEYDGRTYTYCYFCDACLSEGKKHEVDCAYIRATKSKEWQSKLKSIEEHKETIYKHSLEYAREKISCPNCGKKVSRVGLKNHQNDVGC